jgi:DNA polymerase III subunit gamma/tau
MAHIALYRTWRPQAFRDVVGQEPIVRTLQNSLKENRLSHAYLFSGPRGTGKTSVAKILAKAVNCERGPAEEPCNECGACRRITEGSVMDVVEIDAASNRGVDEIRDIRDKVKYAPTEVRQKVYIIDEVHMLTTEAFNALLKTLEEPPAHVMFILATTEPHKLPATIVSRCQRFDFRRISAQEQVDLLADVCRQEDVAAEEEALRYIARLSEGGMRDALSLLDQMISFSGSSVTYAGAVSLTGGIAEDHFAELAATLKSKDIGQALEILERFMQEGKSADKLLESMLHYLRDILMVKLVPDSPAVTDRLIDLTRFKRMAGEFAAEELFHMIEVLNRYQVEMKYSAQPQTLLEIAVMKLCVSGVGTVAGADTAAVAPASAGGTAATAVQERELASLKTRLAQLEQQLASLLQSGPSSPTAGEPAAAPGPAVGTGRQGAAASGSAGASAFRGNGGAGGLKAGPKLAAFADGKESPLFKQALLKWSQVLAQVKERKITVHAWLVDGEPVSLHDDTLLLAFKSSMHRETTDKPANRQLIEQVMSELFGSPTRLATVMQKDWKEAEPDGRGEPEVLRPEPEEPGAPKEEWIREAIELFGEDLVKIKED